MLAVCGRRVVGQEHAERGKRQWHRDSVGLLERDVAAERAGGAPWLTTRCVGRVGTYAVTICRERDAAHAQHLDREDEQIVQVTLNVRREVEFVGRIGLPTSVGGHRGFGGDRRDIDPVCHHVHEAITDAEWIGDRRRAAHLQRVLAFVQSQDPA